MVNSRIPAKTMPCAGPTRIIILSIAALALGLVFTFGLGYVCADGLGLNASYTRYFRFPWRDYRQNWLELSWTSDLYDDVPEPGKRFTFHSAEFHAREFFPGFLAITAASALLTGLAYRMATRD